MSEPTTRIDPREAVGSWPKTATYTLLDGTKRTVEYDALAPCIACGLPVIEASMGGTALCPWCDTGYNRRGDQIVVPRKATPAEYETEVRILLAWAEDRPA